MAAAIACCWRWASALLANIELINDVAAPCMKLLTMGFLVFMTIARLTLLVTVSCAKLPVLEITAPLAPDEEDEDDDDPVPHNCAGVTSGPEITVFAGMTLPPGQVTATPVLHGPTAVAVGVGCACPVSATASISMRMASGVNVKECQFMFRLGSDRDKPSGVANEYAIVNGYPLSAVSQAGERARIGLRGRAVKISCVT